MADTAFWKQLDAQNDESAVRVAIASGHYGPDTVGIAQEWLQRKEDARFNAAATRAEAREVESLSISRKALSTSRLATRIAISAIVVSISMAILEIIKWYYK
ncbi:MAG: hypothetical protein IPJ25_03315 [Rhodocyclaceae bacterium]|nr:hypothetical protein [Rhodocyclaceae bacterium]